MPLSNDPQVNSTAGEIKETMKKIFGTPPGFRPAHARGIIFNGTFKPTEAAKALTTAPHFHAASTPIIVRFSSSTGIPQIPDTDGNANPRGFALRFTLPEKGGLRQHTDVIAHSTPFFPARTGAEFLSFLQALMGGTVGDFLGSHPGALAFVQAPKPFPVSFGKEAYWGVTALKFIDKDGKETYFRHRVVPVLPVEHLTDDEVKEKGPNYLFDEVPALLKEKGEIKFKLLAQLAEEGDVTNDATVHWPESRKVVELGEIILESAVDEKDQAAEAKKIIFDPVPRDVEGLQASDDPLLDMRASLYIQSGKERRAA